MKSCENLGLWANTGKKKCVRFTSEWSKEKFFSWLCSEYHTTDARRKSKQITFRIKVISLWGTLRLISQGRGRHTLVWHCIWVFQLFSQCLVFLNPLWIMKTKYTVALANSKSLSPNQAAQLKYNGKKKACWSSFDYVSEMKSSNYGNRGKMVIQRLPLASKLAQQMEH